MKIKKLFVIAVLTVMLILFGSTNAFANTTSGTFEVVEYSDDFKAWLELPDEEKEKVMQPRMYDIEVKEAPTSNPFFRARLLFSSFSNEFNLKSSIPENLTIRNQMQTNSCWTFAALSSLETNLALADKKSGVTTPTIYNFSERHMEYSNARTFADGATNSMGYNRNVGSGGQWYMAESYLTNGSGAVSEDSLPFENNENLIDISAIQGKQVLTQLYDTIDFADYNVNTSSREQIMNQIKQHIQNYGSVFASVHGNTSASTGFSCYNSSTASKFCSTASGHSADHAVSIIGWDDNFPVSNFASGSTPEYPGAWIIRNSWGDQFGKSGIMYVSYYDINISKTLSGIQKATTDVSYENIYQYDLYYPAGFLKYSIPNIILCTEYTKKTAGKEYLTQVSIYCPETYINCSVYANPNSDNKNFLTLLPLKSGNSKTLEAGYHTLELAEPVEITSNKFLIAIQAQSTNSSGIKIALETTFLEYPVFNNVSIESEKCYIAAVPDSTSTNFDWIDLSKLSAIRDDLPNGDSTIKAFTVTSLPDTSLNRIEITNPPAKTNYLENEDFNKAGMIITAFYNDNTSKVLSDTDYNITNGTNLQVGQTTVTISYGGKSVDVTISVSGNSTPVPTPTITPTITPTEVPTQAPTPTIVPTQAPTPTVTPSIIPTEVPTQAPTPTIVPTQAPTPTVMPSIIPTEVPTEKPTQSPDEGVKNSDLSNAKANIKKIEAHFTSANSDDSYILMDLDVVDLERILSNDSVEYYYYLSNDANEQSIENWTKIGKNQININKINFTIDTRETKNYDEIDSSENLYLYVKEVAKKGGDQSVTVSKSMKLEFSDDIDTFIDNNTTTDDDLFNGKLPQTGANHIAIVSILIISVFAIISFIRYKVLNKYTR